jgi:phospholipid/cholesterol/gamma-HCH transport system permease protein
VSPAARQSSGRLHYHAWRIAEWPWRFAGRLGNLFVGWVAGVASILAVLWATAGLAIRPSTWTAPVRLVFARQVLYTAVDAIPASLRFGAAVGVLMIVQASLWVDMAGAPTEVIAPMLWRAVVREIAPLLACLVVIGRSGIAISAELATMRALGDVEVMDSQGIDPMTFLVMPRILAVVIGVFSLAMVIAVTMVITGYGVGILMGSIRMVWSEFFAEISRNVDFADIVFFASKTLIAGGLAGAICCLGGMKVQGTMTDVPRVTSKAGIQALTAVFAVSAILSILFYGRVLVFQIG